MRRSLWGLVLAGGLVAWGASRAQAPLAEWERESEAVAAHFADPPVSYRTPAFEPGRVEPTSNAELRAAMQALATDVASAGTARLLSVGSSQTGVPLEALRLSRGPGRPTVLLVGQQHGDEPAGSEALLAVAQELAQGSLGAVLDRIDVVILPRANPDGAEARRRGSASGIDVNRDHLLLRTPEAQAMAALVRDFNPVVVVDAHEFGALGRYVEKFGAAQRADALVQYAMVANLPPLVTRASEEWFRQPLLQALKAQGLNSEWYYTTSGDVADKKVSMGGVQPDNGRNVNGLRNAVSFLIETRGADLGRAHLLRRVHTHVVAIGSILKSAAARADDLQKLRRFVDAEVAAKACQGDVIVEAAATPSEYTLAMLDAQTGADKAVNVAWDSALALATVQRRTRPCGYWLGADQADAVLRLRALGVQVHRVDEAGELRGEAYTETARETGARPDVRGSIADGGGVVRVKVALAPALIDASAGSYYIGLDQPLAHLVVAALEPDTQSSFVTNRIVDNVTGLARVLKRPGLKMSAVP
ncbi:MAG: M14 family metallocarboxypeptidase [Burkholderiales bacterium]